MTDRIIATSLRGEMQRSYLEYAMSVIVGRALPDVRDGLKPVHRRILFAMHELGLAPDRPFRKCARVVGDVLGKYHPHGDSAVYEALVRLAQDFASRYPLIEGHGNFGSQDNDPPAAMRYTECRLAPVAAEALLQEVGEPIVDFQDNFDGSAQEPVLLPARLPVLLLNGANGIAVGMATNMLPHNLGEVVDGLVALIDDPQISLEQLMAHIPGPDFPTGGEILGSEALVEVYRTGRGTVLLRGTLELETLETRRTRQALVIRELPYQLSIEALTVKIAELVNEGRIQGVSDLRNESNRTGVRIVLELKRDAQVEVIRNQLFRHTPLEMSFGVIQLALINGEPRLFSLKELLEHFLEFRLTTLTRRIAYDLSQAENKAQMLEASQRVLGRLPECVALLLEADDSAQARQRLQATFDLTADQAEHILQMPLRRLTRLDQRHLLEEAQRWQKEIKELETLLADRKKLLNFLKKELLLLKKKFTNPRRTRLQPTPAATMAAPVLVPDQPWTISFTTQGYLRRQTPSRKQLPEDVLKIHQARSFSHLLVITQTGRAYSLVTHTLPEAKSKGGLVANLIHSTDPVLMTALLEDFAPDGTLILLSAQGRIKRLPVKELTEIAPRGTTLIRLSKEEDALVSVTVADPKAQVLVAFSSGRLVRFPFTEQWVPQGGPTGIKQFPVRQNSRLVGLIMVQPKEEVILLTAMGYVKRLAVQGIQVKEPSAMGTMGLTALQVEDQVVAVAKAGANYAVLTSNKRLIPFPEISATSRTSPAVLGIELVMGEKVVGLIGV